MLSIHLFSLHSLFLSLCPLLSFHCRHISWFQSAPLCPPSPSLSILFSFLLKFFNNLYNSPPFPRRLPCQLSSSSLLPSLFFSIHHASQSAPGPRCQLQAQSHHHAGAVSRRFTLCTRTNAHTHTHADPKWDDYQGFLHLILPMIPSFCSNLILRVN